MLTLKTRIKRFANSAKTYDCGLSDSDATTWEGRVKIKKYIKENGRTEVTESIKQKLIDFGYPEFLYLYVRDAIGFNDPEIEQSIIDTNDHLYINLYAKTIPGADLDKFTKVMIERFDSQSMFQFAKNFQDEVDMEALYQGAKTYAENNHDLWDRNNFYVRQFRRFLDERNAEKEEELVK